MHNSLPTTSDLSFSHNASPNMRLTTNPLPSELRANEMGSGQKPENWHLLNMKKEIDRRKSYERWTVPFMDPHSLAAAGFYYTCQEDIVRCAFCGVEEGCWEEGDDPFRYHQLWSPSCGFHRGLPMVNVPISPNSFNETASVEEASHSYDVCGMFTSLEIRPFSRPERAAPSNRVKLQGMDDLKKYGFNQSRGPVHPYYNTYEARLRSYESWPRALKQKPEQLSEAGFYYTGKGDQTVCFYCGGGVKDWEENDDPWKVHVAWFSKCSHVVLIKGHEFIEKAKLRKEPQKQDYIEPEPPVLEQSVSRPAVSVEQLRGEDNTSTSGASDNSRSCQICFKEERGVLFLPCGHMVACAKCAPSISTCAMCHQAVADIVRAYLS